MKALTTALVAAGAPASPPAHARADAPADTPADAPADAPADVTINASAHAPSAAAAPADDPHWYKDAVIYELHIKAFFDANGDGVGDFAGLIDKLGHVQSLGVNTIWLLPFYPSPQRDDGYDVADFMNVNPTYGSAADVARLVAQAHALGLRVITELVVNHTSDQHPWFQAARRAPKGSPERDFYVWSDDPARYAGTRIIFTDTETSNWTWDPVAGQYFWHRFFSHQPDLNFDNPAVREAVFGVMSFWLDQGVDGFRLDAIPYLIEREGTSNENLRETHQVIKELRQRLDARYANKLLLAEANMWPEDVREYFGDDDECHMAYHFPLMPRMYMAIAQEDRHPVVEILQQTPEISANSQWAIFLRNHDELTLEMVTSKERDYMYSMYAADPRARINLGIRRRLAPLLENDRERIRLMNSLLLSMPGSPVLYYGDEIGMGDNIFLGDRDGVRTPMQWTNDRNGGFSRADPQRLYLPPIQDPVYGYAAVNVEAQERDASSMLNWTRRMLAIRSSTRVFGRGSIAMLHPGNRKVLAYVRQLADEVVLCVANLGRSAQAVELDLKPYAGRVPVEMGGRVAFPRVGDTPYMLSLPGYGFYWFSLDAQAEPPAWHADPRPTQDLPVLVLFDGWNSLFRDRVVPWRISMAAKTLAQFEGELLPGWLAVQRWWVADAAGQAAQPQQAPAQPQRLADHAVLDYDGHEALLALVGPAAGAAPRWFAPLALAWEDGAASSASTSAASSTATSAATSAASAEEERTRLLTPAAVAKVRLQARMGLMGDAMADPAFCRALVQGIAAGRDLRTAHGQLRFRATGAFAAIVGTDIPADRPLRTVAPGTEVVWDERLVLQVLRRVAAGVHPEVEFGRHLTDVLKFEHSVPLAGHISHVSAAGAVSTVLLLQARMTHQGDAWTGAVEQLSRQLERLTPAAPGGAQDAVEEGWLERVRKLAQRTADLHAALARRTGDAAFDPEPTSSADVQRWIDAALPAALEPAERDSLLARCRPLLQGGARGPLRSRIHGAFGLDKVLLTDDDFLITGFAAEAMPAAAGQPARQSPLRDVASLLHSFEQVRRQAVARGVQVGSERRESLSLAWSRSLRASFLQAYADAAVQAGLWPDAAAFEAWRPLLDLFELQAASADRTG